MTFVGPSPFRKTVARSIFGRADVKKLDRWSANGWIRPDASGPRRTWSETEVSIGRWMCELIDAGVEPATAATVARRFVAERTLGNLPVRIKMSSTITIEVNA